MITVKLHLNCVISTKNAQWIIFLDAPTYQ
jgi:hypothetical protein